MAGITGVKVGPGVNLGRSPGCFNNLDTPPSIASAVPTAGVMAGAVVAVAAGVVPGSSP